MDQLDQIEKRLEAIESLLQQLPEIQAATLLTMNEQYQTARLQGKSASDLWVIPDPTQRQIQSVEKEADSE